MGSIISQNKHIQNKSLSFINAISVLYLSFEA